MEKEKLLEIIKKYNNSKIPNLKGKNREKEHSLEYLLDELNTLPKLDYEERSILFQAYKRAKELKDEDDPESEYIVKEIREILTGANIPLVLSVARKIDAPMSFEDKVGYGTMGLLNAFEGYDPDMGFRFSTYAIHWIRQYIVRHKETWGTIKIPAYMMYQFDKLNIYTRDYEREKKRLPTRQEIIELSRYKESDIELYEFHRIKNSENALSIDACVSDDSDNTLGDMIESTSHPESKALLHQYFEPILDEMKNILSQKDYTTFQARSQGCTLQEIGKEIGISREGVRQREVKTHKIIRRYCKRFKEMGLIETDDPEIFLESVQTYIKYVYHRTF